VRLRFCLGKQLLFIARIIRSKQIHSLNRMQRFNIVTRGPIARYQLCKEATVKCPLLGNSSVDTLFSQQRGNTHHIRIEVSVVRREAEAGDILGAQRKANVVRWKPLSSNG
jgi:hypothetical protein